MHRKAYVWPIIGLWVGCCLGVLVVLHVLPFGKGPKTPFVVCRPSAPAQAYHDSTEPVVLLWGNSLLFDYHWYGLEASIVNCAHQGQIAVDAAPKTRFLPQVMPDLIVVAFGSVEALRASKGRQTLDLVGFEDGMADILDQITHKWPEAKVLVNSTPGFADVGILHENDVQNLNVVIERLAFNSGAQYLSIQSLLKDASNPSYDGVHISPKAYYLWEAAIHEILGQ